MVTITFLFGLKLLLPYYFTEAYSRKFIHFRYGYYKSYRFYMEFEPNLSLFW